jgi:CRISPR-associated endonuclease/helicase Cas3
MVQGGSNEQVLRHEHLSALVLMSPSIREWLQLSPAIDVDVVTAAVLSHHLKATDRGDEYLWGQASVGRSLIVHLDDVQVRHTFERVASLLRLPAPPMLAGGTWRSDQGLWPEVMKAGYQAASVFRRELRRDLARRQRSVAVKAGLIAADSVASGLFRTHAAIDAWVEDHAHLSALEGGDVSTRIIEPRLAAIRARTGKAVSLHPFQQGAARAGDRVLLLAACGTGKTLAAWAWADEQARHRKLSRVIFLYPTRGTATEGFRDYAAWAPEAESLLLHGTARYELEQMRENPPEAGRWHELSEAEERLYSLGRWSRRFFSATVDQFLSALENQYGAVCLLPALADAAVVIDEVHSFDRRMFANLVSFLTHFDVPVLCMTATLPRRQREELERAGLRVYPSASESAALSDLAAKEQAPRYRHQPVTSEAEAFELACAHVNEGRRVLWVVNTVARAQSLTERLKAVEPGAFCYHSRFSLADRQRAHARAVAAFQQTTTPAIAVTTQVCEMSLDLDADVLITEHAPVTSLVQRFGRANRHLARPGHLGLLVTYAPERALPYENEELETAGRFLASFGDAAFSQAQLAAALEVHAEGRTEAHDSCALLSGGYYAVRAEFRETDEYTVPSVLDSEVDEVRRLLAMKQGIDGLVVPVPKRHAQLHEGLPRWLHVAQADCYSRELGFVAPEGK